MPEESGIRCGVVETMFCSVHMNSYVKEVHKYDTELKDECSSDKYAVKLGGCCDMTPKTQWMRMKFLHNRGQNSVFDDGLLCSE